MGDKDAVLKEVIETLRKAGEEMEMREKRKKHAFIPLNCQVHTCGNEPVAYCYEGYVFVCQFHLEEFCIPEKHNIEPNLEIAAIECINECERQIKMSLSYIEKQKEEIRRYKRWLEKKK
jgi:hypothetical protein